MLLSEIQNSLLPTDEEVSFYEDHGWYISRKVISDESIDQVLAAIERHYAGEGTTQLPNQEGYSLWRPSDGYDVLRNDEFISLRNPDIRGFLYQPIIAAIGARLMRSPTARLFIDSLLYKPPCDVGGQAVTGWHNDRSYWSTCSSENMITAWIPLNDVTPDLAPLTFLDRSHRWSGFENLRTFKENNLRDFESSLRARGLEFSKVSNLMDRGQISFHHSRTVHCSEANRSDIPRRSFALPFQPKENCYRQAFGPDGEKIVLSCDERCGILPNGDPDYADPKIFPELWRD